MNAPRKDPKIKRPSAFPPSLRRNPSPPEPKIKRRKNASFFCPRSADAVGRAANFRANFHGAAAKLNAPQAFNAPTCHGNSRNASFNVLPRLVPIRAEPPPFPILAERHAFPLFAEKKRENSRNASFNVLPRRVPICAEPSAAPRTRRTPRFSSLRGEKRENSRNAQRSPPQRSNSRRTIRRSRRLHYLTFHKRQGHAKERQL